MGLPCCAPHHCQGAQRLARPSSRPPSARALCGQLYCGSRVVNGPVVIAFGSPAGLREIGSDDERSLDEIVKEACFILGLLAVKQENQMAIINEGERTWPELGLTPGIASCSKVQRVREGLQHTA